MVTARPTPSTWYLVHKQPNQSRSLCMHFVLSSKLTDLLLYFPRFEQVSGRGGAGKISEELTARGVQLKFLLDEGSTIVKDGFAGVDAPVAL